MYCSTAGDHIKCSARKRCAFLCRNEAYAYRHGIHTCTVKKLSKRSRDLVKPTISTDCRINYLNFNHW